MDKIIVEAIHLAKNNDPDVIKFLASILEAKKNLSQKGIDIKLNMSWSID